MTMNSVPEDLLLIIFTYFDASTLFATNEVCTLWRKLSREQDGIIWKHVTKAEIERSSFNRPSEYNIRTRIENVKTAKLLRTLVGMDLSNYIEKHDFQQLLLAKLLFTKVMAKELKGSDKRFAGKYLSIHYPDWALRIPTWKASYLFTRLENNRTELTSTELCQIAWSFSFKYRMGSNGQPVVNEDEATETFRIIFHEDHTMFSQLQPDHRYVWKFIQPYLPNEQVLVQVDAYPALIMAREANTLRWTLENGHVRMNQRLPFDPAAHPLVE